MSETKFLILFLILSKNVDRLIVPNFKNRKENFKWQRK